ncbi:hypothetical protein HMPREF1210_02412 [Paenisporosarcina sp. HGH0030]|uniref:YybS family protein n=1 Tax=Paenisporosarcina sp. HGH0030 TaxID=1078085 RepID=UPI00034E1AF1|nr:DUF2232 domain-containing protein [Paenisporosarcina sp. HGH0030]EPD50904.1 hypothetical protein HMPREF1210_02412 [Paenisporosarcina sp. HGH0030]
MPNEQTKQLTLGAMIIALFSILLAVSFYVPVLNLITILFLALPIAWYSAKFSRAASIYVVVLSMGISYFIGGLMAIPFALIHVLLGFIIGDTIRLKKSKLFMLMASAIVLIVSIVIEYVILVLLFKFNPVKEMLVYTKDQYDQLGTFLESYNTLPKNYDQTISDVLFMFETVMPTLLILGVFCFVFVFINIQLPVLRKLGLDVPKFPAIRHMRLPKSILWYYMIVMVVTLFVELTQGTFAFMVLANVTMMLRVLLTLQGISFIHFYIHEKGWPKWVAIVATFLAFPLQSLTVLLGIFDLGFNIRSFVKDKNKK